MKKKKTTRPAAQPSHRARPRSICRALVLVDQGPLRHKAASECSREMARLERARVEWRKFEVEDKRAFARWEAATFGPLLSRQRELDAALHEKEVLMQQVDLEMFFGGGSARAAYRRVKNYRENPPPDPWQGAGQEPRPGENGFAGAPPPSHDGADDFDGEFVSDEELKEIARFEEYLFFELGLDPQLISDQKYGRLYDEFRARSRKKKRQPPPPTEERSDTHSRIPPGAGAPEKNRVKELYRLLVRRLHPDMRADSNAEVSALWHEVQEAYSRGNEERLEMLLAFTDILSNEVGDQTSLSQMRAVLAELRRAFNALQKNLRAAKKEPAWNFNQRTDRKLLEERMRWELESMIAVKLGELRRIEGLIASWETPPKSRKKKKAGQPPKARRADYEQVDMPF